MSHYFGYDLSKSTSLISYTSTNYMHIAFRGCPSQVWTVVQLEPSRELFCQTAVPYVHASAKGLLITKKSVELPSIFQKRYLGPRTKHELNARAKCMDYYLRQLENTGNGRRLVKTHLHTRQH